VGGADEKGATLPAVGSAAGAACASAEWIHLIRAARHGGQILHDTFPFLCLV